jgi:hypothetical protein
MPETTDAKIAEGTSNPPSSQPLQNTIKNDATGVAILLSNHDAFGFSERFVSLFLTVCVCKSILKTMHLTFI